MKKYLLPILLIGFWGCEEQDTSPPEVNILIPDDVVFEIADIAVEADDNEEISKLEFYIDGELVHTETGSPSYQNVYIYKWNTVQYENGSDHIVRVVAYDNSDNQGSDEANFTVDNSDAGPGEWGPTSVTYTLTEMTITWEEYSEENFKDYNVLYSQEEEGEKGTITTYTDRSTTSHAITEFDPTVENWFWVQVTDTLGLSSIGWGMRNESDSEPATVNITSVTYDTTEMTIIWNESIDDDFQHYNLLYSSSESGVQTSVTTITDRTINSYSITDFNPNLENWYWVEVSDSLGQTSIGNGMTNEINGMNYNPTINSVYIPWLPVPPNDFVTVNWSMFTDNDFYSYELLRADSSYNFTSVAEIKDYNITYYSFDLDEVNLNIENYWRLVATDYWGYSDTGYVKDTWVNQPPNQPNLYDIDYDNINANIGWSINNEDDFYSYELYESLDSTMSGASLVYTTQNQDSNQVLLNVEHNQKLYYQLKTTDIFGLSSISNIKHLTSFITFKIRLDRTMNDIIQLDDGTYVLTGSVDNQAGILKLDSLGNQFFESSIDSTTYGSSIRLTSDGGFIIGGRPWIMKIDSECNLEWHHQFEATGQPGYAKHVEDVGDGYITIGHRYPDAAFAKFNYSGQLIWLNHYEGVYGSVQRIGKTIHELSDGSLILAGGTYASEWVGWLKKWSTEGDSTVWEIINGSPESNAYVHGNDEIGWLSNFLRKVDSNGNILWEVPEINGTNVYQSGICGTNDGGFAAVHPWHSSLAKFARTDSEGNIIWNRPGSQHNSQSIAGNVVRQTKDGGFIILYSGDRYLFKTDPDGNINW